MKEPRLECSFCGKDQESVSRLISNPKEVPMRAYICDECVGVCVSILSDSGMDFTANAGLSLRMRLARRIAGLPRLSELPKKAN